MKKQAKNPEDNTQAYVKKSRQGSPVDCRPSTAEAPPTGKIHTFSKMAVTFEPFPISLKLNSHQLAFFIDPKRTNTS